MCVCFQVIRGLKKALLNRCQYRIKLGDSGDYDSILASFRKLRDSIKPQKIIPCVRPFAKRLKNLLSGFYSRMEAHAVQRHPGVARMVFANISGQADETIYRRLEKQCRDYEVKEAAPRASSDFKSKGFKAGLGEVRSSLYKGKGSGSTPFAPKKDFSRIQCFNCLLFGHYKDHCPSPQVAAADTSK